MATGTPMTFANRDGCGICHRDVHPTRASTQYCAGPGDNSARPETYRERWHSRTVRRQVRTAESVLEAVNGAAVPPLTTMEVDPSDEARSISF